MMKIKKHALMRARIVVAALLLGLMTAAARAEGSITSPLTRPNNTTAYAGSSGTPQLVASSATAGSVVTPSFVLPSGATIPKFILSTNATTGWGGVVLVVTLWTVSPTYSNGDGGTYVPATGAAGRRTAYSCTLTQFGDGASGSCTPADNVPEKLRGNTTVYWDVQIQSAATPIANETFTLTVEDWN